MRYTVWQDYGVEGWRPMEFETAAALLAYLTDSYSTYGPIRITRDVTLVLEET